ncbi:transglutaminase domain-containing protein [Schaalia vaccimaxillae]|uniref:transglutaminase family protein n=1 Tax=Schaalia vaccimaxillae TaxID=183916 RepID=UPI000409BF9D|nr:transglutaminase-like domain-containing protein [Schaalia vaccimaxillae]
MTIPSPPNRRRSAHDSTPMSATMRGRRRGRLPQWSLLVVALLFVGPILTHEPIFGDLSGAFAAAAGVLVGLLIAAASTRWRWDVLSTLAAVLGAHLFLGGAIALPTTTIFRVVPSADTLQTLVLGSVQAWKDLLTITPPASSYVGPALVPWISGLVAATLAGLATARWGRAIVGTIPIIVMGIIGVAFGESGTRPSVWPVVLWWVMVLLWWAGAAQRRRIDAGEDIIVGRGATVTATDAAASSTTGRSRSAVNVGRRAVSALVMAALGAGIALPATIQWGPWNSRIVARDLVEPPLEVRDYPSPLAAYRHYTTDLEKKKLLSIKGLPESSRVRVAVMDSYDGTTFGMSEAETYPDSGYRPVGSRLPEQVVSDGAKPAEMTIETSGIIGPWVPLIGTAHSVVFTGENADAQQDGLHADLWSDTALTTGPTSAMSYTVNSYVEPNLSDGQLNDVKIVDFHGRDSNVPDTIAEAATAISAKEQSPLAKARAIERHLADHGFYSNEDTAQSRPGHRADRLARMLEAEQLIGDDEQYSALMALMLHSLGMNARVVMGFRSPDTGAGSEAIFYGSDMQVWVEVEFEGIGWGVFDPTPPRDQKPQTDIPEPRSVPRPQVLQPPEPPEEPVELPPTTSDKDSKSEDDQRSQIPWGIIAGVSVSILVVISPILAILALKALRRRGRRKADDSRLALVGSWDEVVDLATDAGIDIDAHKTRQETAWELASVWGSPSSSPANEADAAQQPQGHTAIPGWTLFAEEVPTAVAIARRADVANFADGQASREESELAWKDVDALRAELRLGARPLTRIRRALSLKSLLRRRRLRSQRQCLAREAKTNPVNKDAAVASSRLRRCDRRKRQ